MFIVKLVVPELIACHASFGNDFEVLERELAFILEQRDRSCRLACVVDLSAVPWSEEVALPLR